MMTGMATAVSDPARVAWAPLSLLVVSAAEDCPVVSLKHRDDTSVMATGARWARQPRHGPGAKKSPLLAENPQAGGFFGAGYFFLPWFLTASMAAAAASGSRYVPPGFSGLKSASNS